MNISGVLVHAYPEQVVSVSQALEAIQGIEVHASSEVGKMVVTIELANVGEMSDTLLGLQNIPGVLSASMIYHQFDD